MKVIYNFFNFFFFLKITFAPESCATLVKGQTAWDDLKTHNTRGGFGFSPPARRAELRRAEPASSSFGKASNSPGSSPRAPAPASQTTT